MTVISNDVRQLEFLVFILVIPLGEVVSLCRHHGVRAVILLVRQVFQLQLVMLLLVEGMREVFLVFDVQAKRLWEVGQLDRDDVVAVKVLLLLITKITCPGKLCGCCDQACEQSSRTADFPVESVWA